MVLELGALICFSHFNNPTRAGICVEIPGAAHAGVKWPTPTPDIRLLLPSGITVSGIESWVMNPSTLGARYIYEIGVTQGDTLGRGDFPQLDFTGTEIIWLQINCESVGGF